MRVRMGRNIQELLKLKKEALKDLRVETNQQVKERGRFNKVIISALKMNLRVRNNQKFGLMRS